MPRHSAPIKQVTTRGGQRWRVNLSVTKNGVRTRSSKTVDTYEEAQRLYAESQLDGVVPKSKETFDEWADKWLSKKKQQVRCNTYEGYRSDLAHPRAAFGARPIQSITEDDIEDLVLNMARTNTKYGKPPTKRTVSKMLTSLRAVFDLAVRRQVLKFNPATHVGAQGRESEPRDALTAEELTLIREAIRGSDYEAMWMLTLAGMRRSEVLGLTWDDLDLSSGTLTISKARTALNGIDDTKTQLGRRVLPLDDERIALLKEFRAKQAERWGLQQVRDGLVLLNEWGRPMRPEEWTGRWRALCAKTDGVSDRHTLHAARHATVTYMRNAGVPDHVVAAWHGHDEVVMRRTYSHVHPEVMRTAASALVFGAVGKS